MHAMYYLFNLVSRCMLPCITHVRQGSLVTSLATKSRQTLVCVVQYRTVVNNSKINYILGYPRAIADFKAVDWCNSP
jgi:hypothetical protein